VVHQPSGKPELVLTGRAQEVARGLRVARMSISISHSDRYVVAMVISKAMMKLRHDLHYALLPALAILCTVVTTCAQDYACRSGIAAGHRSPEVGSAGACSTDAGIPACGQGQLS